MKSRSRSPRPTPPVLESSPFDSTELLDEQDLSEIDRKFLNEREEAIAAGKRTFLAVGQALLDIKNYQDGRLYKRYGTFEAYCKERWEIGRSYASRIMDATEVYREMLPRGNISVDQSAVLPTTENQIRSLKKLPPLFRLEAWNNAVDAAAGQPLAARFVEKEVRKVMARENLPPAGSVRPEAAKVYRISADAMKKIRGEIARIRKACGDGEQAAKILEAIERLEALLRS